MSLHEGDGDIEQERAEEFSRVKPGRGKREMTSKEAVEVLSPSLRHVGRILAAYRRDGAEALAYSNRELKPHNALNESLKRQVIELAKSTYAACGAALTTTPLISVTENAFWQI
jgi:hypothetical protein